jgi:hypothetical protein
MEKVRIRSNVTLPGYAKAGEIVEVPCDERGTPLDQYWRRRLRDAVKDGCCEIIAASDCTAETEPEGVTEASSDDKG